MKVNLFRNLTLLMLLFCSCSGTKVIMKLPSAKFEGNFSLILNEVISYGKEHMNYAFRGCTKIKSSTHLTDTDLCQVRIWKKQLGSSSSDNTLLPDSTFLFDTTNQWNNLKIDESLINHCIEIHQRINSKHHIMRNLPHHTLIFSPLIPTNQPDFYYLCVVIAKKRDPAEMIFTLIKEGTIFKVVSGFWDNNPCVI